MHWGLWQWDNCNWNQRFTQHLLNRFITGIMVPRSALWLITMAPPQSHALWAKTMVISIDALWVLKRTQQRSPYQIELADKAVSTFSTWHRIPAGVDDLSRSDPLRRRMHVHDLQPKKLHYLKDPLTNYNWLPWGASSVLKSCGQGFHLSSHFCFRFRHKHIHRHTESQTDRQIHTQTHTHNTWNLISLWYASSSFTILCIFMLWFVSIATDENMLNVRIFIHFYTQMQTHVHNIPVDRIWNSAVKLIDPTASTAVHRKFTWTESTSSSFQHLTTSCWCLGH